MLLVLLTTNLSCKFRKKAKMHWNIVKLEEKTQLSASSSVCKACFIGVAVVFIYGREHQCSRRNMKEKEQLELQLLLMSITWAGFWFACFCLDGFFLCILNFY